MRCLMIIGLTLGVSLPLAAWELHGNVAGQLRWFPYDNLAEQPHTQFSLAFEPELYHEWQDGERSVLITPFIRWDQQDSERSHLDLREFSYQALYGDWELRAGLRKVFWGVAESLHLVDIINQTDLVENIDGEDKLGQPMLNLSRFSEWGTWDVFLLPGFRERTFAGREGRLSGLPIIDTDRPLYASAAEDKHVDWALRWSHSLGVFDLGLAHFAGTSREPELVFDAASGRLRPLYQTIDQTSVDAQAIVGDWLLKLEALTRSGQTGGRYGALVTGFEYTLVGIRETPYDLGLIAEYQFDDRGEDAPVSTQNDLVLGARLTLNDAQSSELLLAATFDQDHAEQLWSLETSRRLGADWKATLEVRLIANADESTSPLRVFRDDDLLLFELQRFF